MWKKDSVYQVGEQFQDLKSQKDLTFIKKSYIDYNMNIFRNTISCISEVFKYISIKIVEINTKL